MTSHRLRFRIATLIALMVLTAPVAGARADGMAAGDDGVVKVRSRYPVGETVERLEADIRQKGIVFFGALDQAKLAAGAGVTLRPSVLLTFGNPALGTLFLTANAAAGLDWPVRLLVVEDAKGGVWAEYTDFAWIARRHRITDRDAAFQMASKVIASITDSVQAKEQ